MKKIVDIRFVASKKKSRLWKMPNLGMLVYSDPHHFKNGFDDEDDMEDSFYNLYLTTYEPIKKGEWGYHKQTKKIVKAQFDRYKESYLLKIIATTDEDLDLPKISTKFMYYYCREIGDEYIKQIAVEYCCHSCGMSGVTPKMHKMGCDFKNPTRTKYVPKIINNKVVIKPLEKGYSSKYFINNTLRRAIEKFK